jgi:MFS family permease
MEGKKYAIEPGLLGFVNSSYQLGSIFAVPFAPWFAHRFGRRWSIMLGSGIMVAGALLQGFAQHGMDQPVMSSQPPQLY